VAYEGVAGFILWMTVLPILNLIPCNVKSVCHNEDKVIESSIGAFRDYAKNPILILQSFILIVSICLQYIAGVSITKYGSAAQRTTVSMLRNVFVWVFLMNVQIGDSKETFTFWQLGGFMMLTFGVLVYNEIIVVPIFGFNRYTKIAIEEREKQKEERRSINY
jgi:hypothetical protein